jgi:hypothetical protein
MILKEITEVRIDQIRELNGKKQIVKENTDGGDFWAANLDDLSDDEFHYNEELESWKIIGFLGITHKKEGNKLVEIPRNKFEVDDIVESKSWNIYGDSKAIITGTESNPDDFVVDVYHKGEKVKELENTEIIEEDLDDEKVGILGVNYEFVNEKLGN